MGTHLKAMQNHLPYIELKQLTINRAINRYIFNN